MAWGNAQWSCSCCGRGARRPGLALSSFQRAEEAVLLGTSWGSGAELLCFVSWTNDHSSLRALLQQGALHGPEVSLKLKMLILFALSCVLCVRVFSSSGYP